MLGLSLLADAPLPTTFTSTSPPATEPWTPHRTVSPKGFQAARQRLGTATDVYNTHLEAGGGEADNIARAAQVDALVAALEGWSAGQAVIFTGDFNLRETDPEDLPLIEQPGSGLSGHAGLWTVRRPITSTRSCSAHPPTHN